MESRTGRAGYRIGSDVPAVRYHDVQERRPADPGVARKGNLSIRYAQRMPRPIRAMYVQRTQPSRI